MIGNIISGLCDLALTVCSVETLRINNSDGEKTAEQKEKERKERRLISNVRNVCYLAKRATR